jgi:hypothetical protein
MYKNTINKRDEINISANNINCALLLSLDASKEKDNNDNLKLL